MANSIVLAQSIVKGKIDVSKWSADVERAAQDAVYQLGQEVRDKARMLAPMRTGALRASIYVTRPGTMQAQSQGKLSKQSSSGYARSISRAEALNPGALSVIRDSKHISVRTQRDLSPTGHWDHLKRLRVTRTHQSPFKRFGSQTYTAFEDDYRSISPLADTSRGVFYVTIGAAAFYAGFVEYGTVKQRAHPFMTPAVMWGRAQLAQRLKAAIGSQKATEVTSVR